MNSTFAEYKSSGHGTSRKRNHPYSQIDRTPLTLSTTKTVQQNDSSKSDDQPNKVIDVGKKLLVGNVEQVVCWCHQLTFIEPNKIIYQVYGIMESVQTGSNKCEKIFCLRSIHQRSGLVCVFYEIDRKIPSVPKGALVLCTGHIKGKNKLQIFTIRELHEGNENSFDRISFVSQWAVNDILLYNQV